APHQTSGCCRAYSPAPTRHNEARRSAAANPRRAGTPTAVETLPAGRIRLWIPSDLQFADQRVDHRAEISVMFLGGPSLPLIRRSTLGNVGHRGQLVGAIQGF